jgi:hypothetical protein
VGVAGVEFGEDFPCLVRAPVVDDEDLVVVAARTSSTNLESPSSSL